MQNRLRAEVLSIKLLSEEDRENIFELYSFYYGGIDKNLFLQDLNEKHWVILLRDNVQKIQGFTTLLVGEHQILEQTIRSIFSGDTIIHHEFWGEQTLPLTWCHFAGKIKAQNPDLPLYWFLIVKGHRTYRYLRLFAKKFYPVHSEPTPKHFQTIMNRMGQEKFGNHYHPETGLIKFKTTHGHLKKKWSGIDKRALQKTDVKFFLEKNPMHHEGDELVCLTELTESNLRRFALTAFREGLEG